MIEKTYAYHKPSQRSLEAITRLRQAFSDLHQILKAELPICRHQALTMTAIEEAAMWAVKAVVFNDPDAVAETA